MKPSSQKLAKCHQEIDQMLALVKAERVRQINKWGVNHRCNDTWAVILGEEVGELCQAILQVQFDSDNEQTRAEIVKEAIQVAAVALAIAQKESYSVAV